MSSINTFSYVSQLTTLLLMLLLLLVQADCLEFHYPRFYKENITSFFTFKDENINRGAIQVTPDNLEASLFNFSGRVLYGKQLNLWSKKKNETSSFNSTFVLNITPEENSGGEGLTFLLTDDKSLPENSHGQWLGLFNSTINGTSITKTVAVEFDTKKSYPEDLEGGHVGVDLNNSIISVKQVGLLRYGVNLSSGTDVKVTVLYDRFKLKVFAVMFDNATINYSADPIVSVDIKLSEYLPEDVYFGFSASTGESTQLNCVRQWHFNSTDIQEDSAHKMLWLWILIPCILIILILLGIAYCIYTKIIYKMVPGPEPIDIDDDKYPGIEEEIKISTSAPGKYQLKDLVYATDDFNVKNKLGEGGFGVVYKGALHNKEVAVKRISKDSRQGKQEFLAEVQTISGLHHKNLVKLLGWCYESNELLLVYEYMPKGSLDKLIFFDPSAKSSEEISSKLLCWEERHSIIYGVGKALDYLHNGCEKRVLHRDIKASNIMLDWNLNPRLGDFGLARTLQSSERTHHSTKEIAGTPGYIAPEFFHTGRASAEVDVYAFGILVLEVACGKKPRNMNEQNHYVNGVVDWVWELYKQDKIIDAIDERMKGEFERDQAECVLLLGLACCHPNPYNRPTMTNVLQVLTGEAEPPRLPIEKPVFMWPAMAPLSFSLNDLSLSGSGQVVSFSEITGR